MKIAIDRGPLTGGHAVRGVGFYTKSLVEYLGKIKELKIDVIDFQKADLSKYDIVHYPFFHPFFITLPLSKKTKTVVTVHDLIPLIYPKHYPSGLRGKVKFQIQKLLSRKIDTVVTVSETSKKDIVRFLNISQDKIEVIYEAPRRVFRKLENGKWRQEIKKQYDLPERFVLYVGDVNYNKNILGLAEACKAAKVPLVIVGKQAVDEDFAKSHPENRLFARFLEKYGDDPQVLRLGYLPDEDLVAVYNLATLYCQPSFYEGFGLPVLEAMACQTPVVAAKTQALVEIVEGTVLFADPKDPKDMAEKILRLFEDTELRAFLIRKGRERVKEFSWAKTAKETFQIYEQILRK
jgi:glycosyltransferase involved in cell wall biosynthesis